jgi:hypothetical protein
MPLPPPASACRHKPGKGLYRHSDPDARRLARLACGDWKCVICRKRRADRWGVHLAGKIRAAAGAGLSLWAVQAPPGREKAVGAAVAKARQKGAMYARVIAGSAYCWLLAAKERPIPEAEALAGSDPVAAACRVLGGWLLEARPAPRGRCQPVTSCRKWALPGKQASDWRTTKNLQALCAREAETYLHVFMEFGVRPLSVDKDAGEFAFRINWRVPEGWNTDDIERFEDALARAQDPLPRPATPDDDGLSAEAIWGDWSPPPRSGIDRQAPAAVVAGIELSVGELEELKRAQAAGFLETGPWLPLGSRVPEAWKRWCDEQGLPANVKEVSAVSGGRGDVQGGRVGAA